jgi:hypothetical protein
MGIVMGVDIGQKRDPTAIAVVEHERRVVGRKPVTSGDVIVRWKEQTEHHYSARHLERLPLGTPYPEVARRVAELADGVKERTGKRASKLYVDATGVGQPVVDMLKETGVRPVGVYFNYGDKRVETSRTQISLGKAYLVSRLQALLQSGRIHLPRTDEAEALAQELLEYEIRVDQNANDRYGAFRVGTHDDLVTALGLAVQAEPKHLFLGRASGPYTRIPI